MAETTAPRTGDRRRLVIVAAAGLSALALLIWMVTGQTQAGFTAETRNDDNLFKAGSITITSDKPGVLILQSGAMLPGDFVEGDITVTNGAQAPLKLKIFSKNLAETPSAASGIAENLNVTVTRTAPGVTVPVFSGTVAQLATQATSFANGKSGTAGGDPLAKATETGDSTSYHWKVELDPAAGIPSKNVNPNDQAVIEIVFEGRA